MQGTTTMVYAGTTTLGTPTTLPALPYMPCTARTCAGQTLERAVVERVVSDARVSVVGCVSVLKVVYSGEVLRAKQGILGLNPFYK